MRSPTVGAKHSGDNLSDKTLDFLPECFALTPGIKIDEFLGGRSPTVGAKHSGDNLSDKTRDFLPECFALTHAVVPYQYTGMIIYCCGIAKV